MDYRSVGDLTSCHQMDANQQSFVTVIPVEFSTSRASSEHGFLDDSGDYAQDCLSKEFLMRDLKKSSRYDELRYYNSDVGSGSAASQRAQPSSSHYDNDRRRLEQLDAFSSAVRYPAGTVTLGRRRNAAPKCRDPLDLGYYRSHSRSSNTAAVASVGTGAAGGVSADNGGSECYRLSSVAASHLQHQYLTSMNQQHQQQYRACKTRQMPPHQASSQLPSGTRYDPQRQRSEHIQSVAKMQLGSNNQTRRCYNKSIYGQRDLPNDKREMSIVADQYHKVRETHSESSIQGLNLHMHSQIYTKGATTRATQGSSQFPPPPPVLKATPASLTSNQILPPPVGYQNQPNRSNNKRQPQTSVSSSQQSQYPHPHMHHYHQQHAQTHQYHHHGATPGHKTHLPEPSVCKQMRSATPIRRVKKKAPPVEICVFLMSQHAIRLECDDVRDLTAAHLLQTVLEEEELALPPAASQVFGIWMVSPLLEIQLKPHHQPLDINHHWQSLLLKHTSANEAEIAKDIPIISFQRSVYFPKREEMRLKDAHVLELLYEEARYNVLEGRYPCEMEDLILMGALQARVDLGQYDPDVHTSEFIKSHLRDYVPEHIVNGRWSWTSLMDNKSSLEARIIEQYARLPANATRRKLMHRYLQMCWLLPCYGSAFFSGQVEAPQRSLLSLFYRPDVPVLVAINDTGVHLVEKQHRTILLSVTYGEMAWDFARPCQESLRECLPCVFLQFADVEFGNRVYHVLQVFSKQSVLMDALITSQVETSRQRTRLYGSVSNDDLDEPDMIGGDTAGDSDEPLAPQATKATSGGRRCNRSSLSRRLDKLTLATFAEDGDCIRKMGSWSFSK